MTFVDEFNRPLAGGTALKDACTLHEGIVAYNNGQQVVLHKSPRIGRPAMTEPSVFADGKCQLVRTRVPQSPAQATAVVQRAWAEVQCGGSPWTVFDNCEDFVSRAYGSNGSATRTLVVGILALVGFFAVIRSNA
jgi:hypothetical protein